MMFEVADLAVASPATVSRCGMVYLEPSVLGLKPFVECWIRKLPDSIFALRDKLNKLFDAFLEVRYSYSLFSFQNDNIYSIEFRLLACNQIHP